MPVRQAACSRSPEARLRSRGRDRGVQDGRILDDRSPARYGQERRCRSRLVAIDGTVLKKLDIKDDASATAIKAAIEGQDFRVASVEKKAAKRNPYPPFTTSTLQMDASRKLGFSAKQTMQIAQRLYEGVDIGGETVGLITYMRTDGVQIVPEAVGHIRDVISAEFGKRYTPFAREYKTKAKNTQEAHEAIRPTDPRRTRRTGPQASRSGPGCASMI